MNNKELTLDDIKRTAHNTEGEQLVAVDITKVVPKKESTDSKASARKELSDKIDSALDRVKGIYMEEIKEEAADREAAKVDNEIDGVDQDSSDYVMQIINGEDDISEDDFDAELEEETASLIQQETETMIEQSNQISQTSDLGDSDVEDGDFDDLELEEDDVNKDADREEEIKEFTNDIAEKINPISKTINLSGIKVSKKPVAISNAILEYNRNKHVTDWVMYADKKNFSIESFTGTEIDDIDARNYGQRNRFNMYMHIYTKIFEHIVGLKGKTTVEAWLKSTNFFSMNDIWFGIYKASFEKANIVPYDCPECKASFVKEVPISDMVKYKNETVKKNFQKIFESTNNGDGSYETVRIPISDKIAVDLREPSIWNVIFENAILESDFREKYSKLLSTITYIDAMYLIKYDKETGEVVELQPIQPKEYPNNMLKTIKHRIYTYAKLIGTLSSDEKAVIASYINTIVSKHDSVNYVVPETTCEKCGKLIPAKERTGEQLLFTRQDLADIANFSHK